MNSKDLYNAICKVDDDILEKSEAAAGMPKVKSKRLIFAAIAACLCLAIFNIWELRAEGMPVTDYEDGVTIPQMNASLSVNGLTDMIGFFLYQGRHYVQYDWINEEDDDVDLIGEYLGTATGSIDEWTLADGYVEFAGSVRGDFYAVKGYDPAFILCMKQSADVVSLYICNNGITLKYGSELFEDRFHLSGNLKSVQYESHDSWFNEREERYQMNSVNQIILDFIKSMDSAQFIPYEAVPSDEDRIEELYHLFFQMENGMTVHLRLYENGYIRCQGMWSLYIQVPEKIYNKLLNLLDTHAGSAMAETAGPDL